MEDLMLLIEKLINKKISSEESLELHKLFKEYQIDENKLTSFYFKKWEESNSDEKINNSKKEKIWKLIKDNLKYSNLNLNQRIHFNWIKTVASILLLILLTGAGIYIYSNQKNNYAKNLSVIAENGQKSKIELPDGSLVWLNSESKISYPLDFGKRNRILNLIGEAYFDVKKDNSKPFIVKTSNGLNVRVLGTKFNIKSYDNDEVITSSLIEGKIEVSNEEHSTTLNPFEEIVVNKKDGKFIKTNIENEDEKIYWIGKNLRFKDENLADIVRVLERMYEVEFHFESKELQNIKYSGEIKNTELDNVLSLISIVSPVEFKSNNSDILVKRK